jgi:hypothetical protein
MKRFHQVHNFTYDIVDKFFLPCDPKCPINTLMGSSRLWDHTGVYDKMNVGERVAFSGTTHLIRVS